ncbi:MAG: penicillin acylase family protein [Rhodospirillaceae bacterium]|nr:penicillin acylase family protein [Rhodospirillaceae bacterium]
MKPLIQALFAFAAVLCLATGGTYVWLRGSLPVMEGIIELTGLTAPVRIIRDQNAVPHIYAENVRDVMFGLGYAHAQDRLWQMEINRRIGAGRLAEILGPPARNTDRFLRTLGIRRAAQRTYDELDRQTRDVLDSYAAGVNAFLDTHDALLPPEFLILNHQPEPWAPQDSLAWAKMMAWDLALNWRNELLRLRLIKLAGLQPDQLAEFFPPYPGDAPVALPNFTSIWSRSPVEVADMPATRARSSANGSNNWAIDGTRTATGKPLLANDPHLGLGVPSVWYLAHLDCPEFRAIGATLPGVAGIILGRNDRIAWGFTNLNADVQDLYVEKLATGDPNSYVTPDGPRPLAIHPEVVHVRDADDLRFDARETIHGPVISYASPRTADAAESSHVISLAWTALRRGDTTARAILHMNRARNWKEFTDALRDFKDPQQNVVYADVDGNIGYYAVGRVPIRRPTNAVQGTMPVPGWDATYEWTGYIPFEEMPHVYNPDGGSIATANHKIVGEAYPHFISKNWAPPYRIRRIETMLAEVDRHTISDMQRIQADNTSLVAVDFLPLFLGRIAVDDANRPFVDMLSEWDGTMDRHRPEPLLFWAWYREITRLLLEDDIGTLFGEFWSARPLLVNDVLNHRQHLCDDKRTRRDETCSEIITQALASATAYLTGKYGPHPTAWRWGKAHVAYAGHTPFSRQPLLAHLFDIVLESDGDGFTVNAAAHRIGNQRKPFQQSHGAGYRAIYDLSDPDRSLYMHSTGQSGNILSSYYGNFAKDWRDVVYVSMSMDRADILEGALGTLLLQPRR